MDMTIVGICFVYSVFYLSLCSALCMLSVVAHYSFLDVFFLFQCFTHHFNYVVLCVF